MTEPSSQLQPQTTHGSRWLAAYTRPRSEQKVEAFFRDRGFQCLLPMYQVWRRWSDRRKLVSFPLFPSYVFVRVDDADRRRAVQAPGFLWFVHNEQGPLEVDAEELNTVRRLLASGLEYDPLPNIEIGDEVELIAGPMCGCRGRLLRKSPNSVAFTVTAINGSVRVNVPDPTWIAPVSGARAVRTDNANIRLGRGAAEPPSQAAVR